MSRKPRTLANVRAHMERRIQDCDKTMPTTGIAAPPITTLAELRERVERRMDACKREAQEKELWVGRKASFETSAYEMEWVLGAISQIEHAEKNHLAALYADDALEHPGQLTEEQKQRNLENLKAYSQEAQIPDGAPWRDVLRALRVCASLWEPGARIQGNLRADDIARACAQAIAEIEAVCHRPI